MHGLVAELCAGVKIDELATTLDLDLALVVKNPDAEVVTEQLLQAGNGLLAAAGGAGDHLIKKMLHTCCQLLLAALVNLELLVAVCKLVLACRKLLLARCELLLGVGELLLACCDLFFCCRKLLLACCNGLLGLGKLCHAVFVFLELSLAVSYHLVHECGEIGNVIGNGDAEIGCDGTNGLYEPCLSALKAGQLCDGAVTELDILVEIRHEGLDLCKLFLAFVVGLSILGNFLLTCLVFLLARFKSLYAFCVSLFALLEGLLTCVILFVACIEGALTGRQLNETSLICADTVEVDILIFLELLDTVASGCDTL